MGVFKKCTFTSLQKAELLWWADQLDEADEVMEQGTVALKRQLDNSEDCQYCCLGIYLEARAPEAFLGMQPWSQEFFTAGVEDIVQMGDPSENTTFLPVKYKKRLGFGKEANRFLEETFTQMNDDMMMTFAEIAAVIRMLVETGYMPDAVMDKYWGVE